MGRDGKGDEPSEQSAWFAAEPVVTPEPIAFGDLRRVVPVSRQWGFDRGLPIDRYYIEGFLARHAADIRGRVLEIQDDTYTQRFGADRVTVRDVLHVIEGNPKATIVADLTEANHIPSAIFDCIVLTQTLNYIYDVRAALKTVYRILKPGGVLLATVPGICHQADPGSAFWNFTTMSVRQLFAEAFLPTHVQVESHGNVLAAIAFLHGLATQELRQDELDYYDPEYEVSITVRAVKQRTP
jgi:SAM-dependent methyltransferase